MPLSPDDIERRQFLPALRGYDRDQVDAFLSEVAEDYRALLRKFDLFRKQQQAAPPGASDQLSGLGERVERVLRIAVQSAKEIRAAAEEEVARLQEEARRQLEAGQQALTRAAHQSEMVAGEAAALTTRRQEAQRALEEAAEVRATAEREAAEALTTAERDVAELRRAAGRETAELREAAEREAAEIRGAAEREAAELREAAEIRGAAEREASEIRGAADWACQQSANVLEAAEEELRVALQLRAEQEQELGTAAVAQPSNEAQPDPGPDADRRDSSQPTSSRSWFPFSDD
ncbi:MAG TPA: DivIVA domain-containing protein [Acidimicrobiales bacterium]|nr:DivIVA domain-containing protein [Acidimicrobiales bacterium]